MSITIALWKMIVRMVSPTCQQSTAFIIADFRVTCRRLLFFIIRPRWGFTLYNFRRNAIGSYFQQTSFEQLRDHGQPVAVRLWFFGQERRHLARDLLCRERRVAILPDQPPAAFSVKPSPRRGSKSTHEPRRMRRLRSWACAPGAPAASSCWTRQAA